MWVYTPPANQVGPAPHAYPIGFSLVVVADGTIALMLSTTFWVLARYWFHSARRLATEALIASIQQDSG